MSTAGPLPFPHRRPGSPWGPGADMLISPGGGRDLRQQRSRAPRPAARRTRCHVRGATAGTITCPQLVAGGRTLAGHPSGTSDRRGHEHGHHQRGHVCRTQPSGRQSFRKRGRSIRRAGSLPLLCSPSRRLGLRLRTIIVRRLAWRGSITARARRRPRRVSLIYPLLTVAPEVAILWLLAAIGEVGGSLCAASFGSWQSR